MLYLDLDELRALQSAPWFRRAARARLIEFRRDDYLGVPDVPLIDAVRLLVEERTGRRPRGPIRMLTQLRQWGFCFNPVTFYYCFDPAGGLDAVAAEITNTPWNERHTYVLDAARNLGSAARHRYRVQKQFHVSPFMTMAQEYDWRFIVPERRLIVHMENHSDGRRLFDATLTLRRQPLTAPALLGMLLRYPFMPAAVLAAIYFQALRLWWLRTPFVPHPKHAGSL